MDVKKDELAIKVENVSKTFKLPHEKQNSIKSLIINFYRRKKTYETQQVLKNISFEIKKGEFFGIVGRNGSGKSTLLKLIAGIYTPTEGNITINGQLTPFIELGVGFNPELTGRENVFLNGALLGFSRKRMESMYDDIVAFAEIERFMDQKLKNYSSGMQVRLAFSIAIRAQTDILLIDEVLAVGDTAFQKKCYEHFVHLKKQGKTVILVTHDMSAVERFCDKAMVIHQGDIVKGVLTAREAARLYDRLNAEDSGTKNKKSAAENKANRWGTKSVQFEKIAIKDFVKKDKGKYLIKQGQDLKILFKLSSSDTIRNVVVGLAFFNQYGVNVSGPNSIGKALSPGKATEFSIPKISFNPGHYQVTCILFDEDIVTEYDHIEKGLVFEVEADNHQKHGVIDLFGEWRQHEN